jgi:hypothetical protein
LAITNININQKNIINKKLPIKPIFKCDRDEKVNKNFNFKLINKIKESLRKKSVVFCEEHHSSNYKIKFQIKNENIIRDYTITVENDSSKILVYEKFINYNINLLFTNHDGK